MREEWLPLSISLLAVLVVIWMMLLSSNMPYLQPRELDQSGEVHTSSVDDLQRFRINGVESSNDWIVQHDNNQFSVTGFLVKVNDGFEDYGSDIFRESILFVPERVSGVIIYHVIPFFETSGTTYELLYGAERDDNIDDSLIDEVRIPLPSEDDHSIDAAFPPDLGFRLVQLDFNTQYGRIHADHIGDYWNLLYRYGEYSSSLILWHAFSVDDLGGFFPDQNFGSSFWLDVSDNEIFELSGIYAGGNLIQASQDFSLKRPHRLPDGEYVRAHISVPVWLGNVTICHLVPVYFSNRGDVEYFEKDLTKLQWGWELTIPVTVAYSSLVFSGYE